MVNKKQKKNVICQVVIPVNHPKQPEPHEVDTAIALARHYQASVEFLLPFDDYKRKSADIKMLGVEWELKSPQGASKSTIQNQFRRASKQAKNIIIDTRRTKLRDEVIEKRIQLELKDSSSVKKVILVNKFGNVVEIKM